MKTAENKRKKHVVLKVLLVIILLFVIAGIGVYVWQKDNIDSAIVGLQYSQKDIADKITESKVSTEQSLKKYNLPITRDFTVEEEEKIRKGEMTVEEAMANIRNESLQATSQGATHSSEAQSNQSQNTNQSSDGSKNVNTDEITKEDEIIGRYVTEVYSLKAYYIGQLGAVEKMLKKEYIATGKDKTKISSIVSGHLGEIAAMEGECDKKINTLLSDLRSELVAINADTSIVNVIEDAYVNEKSLRKSYYLSQYK